MSKNIGSRWFEENKQHWLKYVPVSASIVGDWTFDDVANFFASGTDRAVLCAQEIDTLLDNFFVMDGDSTYSYKMPRYYRERLLCVKKTFINYNTLLHHGKPVPDMRFTESQLLPEQQHFAYYYAPAQITYKSVIRKDVRYVSENFLSSAFAFRASLRIMHRYQTEFDAIKITNPSLQDIEIDICLLRQRARAQLFRERMSTSSLRDFYNSNMWKHREFDYESDGILDYNIFNS